MELLESVKVITTATGKEKYCDGVKASGHGWKARIDGYGATPTAKQLYTNMKNAGMTVPAAPKRNRGYWRLDDCGPNRFPFQSHHLIPKKHLPKHPVCVWLTAKWKKDPKYQLSEDTNFDTDHQRNGYFMPFASNIDAWNKAKGPAKQLVCDELTQRTGIQLHQGSHTRQKYGDDIDDIETEAYLNQVDKLLDLINGPTQVHVTTCVECKTKQSGKTKVQPLEPVEKLVYLVAETLKALINSNRIFVSERACITWKKNPT
jgi:hypothetical protein